VECSKEGCTNRVDTKRASPAMKREQLCFKHLVMKYRKEIVKAREKRELEELRKEIENPQA